MGSRARIPGRVFVAAALLLQPSLARAAAGWTSSATIAEIIATETGATVIMSAGLSNPAACSSATWLRLSSLAGNYPLVSAVILTAKAQNKPIKFGISQCDTDGVSLIIAAWSN